MDENYSEESEKSTNRVYQILRRKIIEGNYPPDKKIVQNRLASELNISRTPVIKALHKLEMEGLVDNIPRKGFFIHRVSLSEIIDLFTLRQSLEMIAAANAAENATPGEVDEMESFFLPFVNNKDAIDAKKYYLADSKFHNYLISLCRNSLVNKINNSMQIMSKIYTSGLLRKPEETIDEHLQIIDAIRRREIEHARILMMQHLEVTQKRMQKTAERLKNMGVDISKIPIRGLEIDEGNEK